MEVFAGKTMHPMQFILNPYKVDCHRYPETQAPAMNMDAREWRPESWNIGCHHCGDIWAKRVVLRDDNPHWNWKTWPCFRCGYGSLWDPWNEPWNMSLPTELLHRELDMVQHWYDLGIKTYNDYFKYRHFRRKI